MKTAATPNKTDAGNGSKAICRVSNVLRSPSADPRRSAKKMNDQGKCEHCDARFEYALLHNGFNDSAYAYCDRCGSLSILDGWKIPEGIKCEIHKPISATYEPMLQTCSCGGRFRGDSSPRCPTCHQLLSAALATEWIEKNAPGSAKGWRWQRNWTGIYAISINKNFVKDNWKPTEAEHGEGGKALPATS